jgi:hypothetical protein
MVDVELRKHCEFVMKTIADGFVVPFLGAGVNLADRPMYGPYNLEKYPPDGKELCASIIREFGYPFSADQDNLLRVSWHVSLTRHRSLYRHLGKIFSNPYVPTSVHRLFASLPRRLAEKGYPNTYQLIITTNYDEVMEDAFDLEGVEYDVVTYISNSSETTELGKFRHKPWKEDPYILNNSTDRLPIKKNGALERPIILKVHGAVDKNDHLKSNFVITEDDYLNYLARLGTPVQIQPLLRNVMKDANFLFLGYSLSDWNLRVILRSIWAEQSLKETSWAVMDKTKEWDETYWKENRVEFLKLSLNEYVSQLSLALDDLKVGSI